MFNIAMLAPVIEGPMSNPLRPSAIRALQRLQPSELVQLKQSTKDRYRTIEDSKQLGADAERVSRR